MSVVEIMLVRHGKPAALAILTKDPISGREIGQWARLYNGVGITKDLEPSEDLRRFASSAGYVMASDLRRSIESARWLASPRDVHIDADLREAVLPDSLGVPLRMPPGVWVVVARVAWWFNWSRSSETRHATQQRASRAADRLCAMASEHGTVLVVGHGMFNRFLATQLLRRGWRGPRPLSNAYWTGGRFTRAG